MQQRWARAPFPYFGGKMGIAAAIWQRLGDVPNYIEPFFGSGAVLLARPPHPDATRIETVNDRDGFVVNFWRAVTAEPDAVAAHADWPVTESDYYARHAWLTAQRPSLTARLEGDPRYYDARIAGWWCWAMCLSIDGAVGTGNGPWHQEEREGGRVLVYRPGSTGGIQRACIDLHHIGRGLLAQQAWGQVQAWLRYLQQRLRYVRVCCGDWRRVCRPSLTIHTASLTGIFLDPPYSPSFRDPTLYAVETPSVAQDVAAWAIAHGDDPRLRIAVCGYEGEHTFPASWTALRWTRPINRARRAQTKAFAVREMVWFSPHCLPARAEQGELFG